MGSLLGLPVPSSDWREVRAAMERLLHTDGALDREVTVPGVGEMPRVQVLEICINDLLIHAWDLARAIGADDSLPEDLVISCYAWLRALPVEVLRAPGRYASALEVEEDADVQTQLLAFAGRRR